MYTIGNPLIAQRMLRHDLRAGLNVPLRLLVLEDEERAGTRILYHLPSSIIAISGNSKLTEAAEDLDGRLERFVSMIVSDTNETRE